MHICICLCNFCVWHYSVCLMEVVVVMLGITLLKITHCKCLNFIFQPSEHFQITNLLSGRVMVFNATFNNISVISWRSVLLVEQTGVPGKNNRTVASYWQTLSHNVGFEYILTWAGFKLTTLVVIDTECIGSCKSNYHRITTMNAHNYFIDISINNRNVRHYPKLSYKYNPFNLSTGLCLSRS